MEIENGMQDKLIKVAWVGIGYLIFKKVMADAKKKKEEQDKSQTEIEAGKGVLEAKQAIALRTALNPWGHGWTDWLDGTDEDMLYKIAPQIKNYASVQEWYKKYTEGGSLIDDLRADLSTSEYEKFDSLVSSSNENKGKGSAGGAGGNTSSSTPGKSDPINAFRYGKLGTELYANNANGGYGNVYKQPLAKPVILYTQYKRGGLLGKLTKRHILKIVTNGKVLVEYWYQVSNIPGQNRSMVGYVREREVK